MTTTWQANQPWQTGGAPTQSPMGAGRSDDDDRPLGELFSNLARSLQTLIGKEVELAKAELKEQAAVAGKGAGLLSAGAVGGLLALFLLSFAAAWGLAEVMPVWAGFLIMGAVYALVAGGLLMAGKKRLASVRPAPTQTVETLRRDVETAKTSLQRGVHA
jgi:hypothetical protein